MQTLAERPIATRPRACDAALAALDRALEDIATVVAAITPEVYRAKPLPELSGSIGEHVRHCLDHVMTLVSAGPSSELSYDRRARGTRIETDPAAALRSIQILRIQVAVGRWSKRADEPIVVSSTISRGGAEVNTTSTLARELAFVLNHTIHHQATIGLLASLEGFNVPDGFGCAPSTPRAVASRAV